MSAAETLSAQCCVVGGGPAGMMLGLLLARAGVRVVVLEKHADFLRDFRGDTVHPSTLEVMSQIGLLDSFLQLPHQRVEQLRVEVGGREVGIADFRHLPTRCRFVAFMPQWDFLNFLAARAARYQSFSLRMETEATELIEENGTVIGVRANGPHGPLEVRSQLVVGADGRHSQLRSQMHMEVDSFGAPMDVLWFRLARGPNDPRQPLGRFGSGRILILLDRGDYWQVGYVIPKGSLEEVREAGLSAFRSNLAEMAPILRERLREIESWDDLKLLTVRIDRLRRWYRPGFLFIGDAAHAMSPVGGVGINLAIQDAVAAANVIAQPLRDQNLKTDHLRRVQRRRELPTRLTQQLQMMMQTRVVSRALNARGRVIRPPLMFRMLDHFPLLRRIPARLMGMGVRLERVETHEVAAGSVAQAFPSPSEDRQR